MLPSNDLIYRIDPEDRVIFVGPGWDSFAVSNGGETVLTQHVVGRSLWDFIADPTTSHLYQLLVKQVRTPSTVTFPFRCDSPTRRRFMEMTIRPLTDGVVEFSTRTMAEEERPYVALDAPSTSGSMLGSIPGSGPCPVVRSCGWCNRVEADGEWVEVERAVRSLGLFERAVPPDLTHGMCDACFEAISETLDEPRGRDVEP